MQAAAASTAPKVGAAAHFAALRAVSLHVKTVLAWGHSPDPRPAAVGGKGAVQSAAAVPMQY